jgi:hypothetical protein
VPGYDRTVPTGRGPFGLGPKSPDLATIMLSLWEEDTLIKLALMRFQPWETSK